MNALNRRWILVPALAAWPVAAGCDRAAERSPGVEQASTNSAERTADGPPGRAVYERYCIMCHGENLEGTQLGPSLVDGAWPEGRTAGQADIAAVVREGVPDPAEFGVPMPPAEGALMTEDQVTSVAAYVASLAR